MISIPRYPSISQFYIPLLSPALALSAFCFSKARRALAKRSARSKGTALGSDSSAWRNRGSGAGDGRNSRT